MKEITYKADCIIVGGGLAGIVTALDLLDSNLNILIIDRDKAEAFGGLAKWSFGGMFFVNSTLQKKRGIQDTIERATRDWFSFAEFDESEYWGKEWAKQYIHFCTPHGYKWLKKQGISFFPFLNWVERGLDRPGNSVPRFHMVWGTGWGLVHTLIKRLKAHPKFGNVQLCFGHRVSEIIVENGQVAGVIGQIESTNQPFEAKGSTVVVATGGINGSIERIKENWFKPWGVPPKKILNGAHPYAVGDLHDATSRINGHVVNLDKQWNYAAGIHHYNSTTPNHGLSLVPSKSALWLNYEGKRLGPRPLVAAFDTRYLVERICQEPVKYSWQLMNYKIALKEFAISGSEHNPHVRDKKFFSFLYQLFVSGNKKLVDEVIAQCQDVVIGYSIEELVEKMNQLAPEHPVQLDLVKEAIQQYDKEVELGPEHSKDEQIKLIAKAREYRGDRARTCNFQKINDPKSYPLIAIREFILSRKSLGGIQTDLQSRVLTPPDSKGKQNPIDGLYAIGEAAGFGGGGMHGYRSLEGTFLGGCVITARVAAKAIQGKKLE